MISYIAEICNSNMTHYLRQWSLKKEKKTFEKDKILKLKESDIWQIHFCQSSMARSLLLTPKHLHIQ